MQYSMGIDAGGTYTDSVIIRDSDGAVIDSNKALTTYPDLLEGIKNSLDGLDQEYLTKVKLVSVSTTLSTNTILEKTGYPVALLMIGDYSIPEGHSIDNSVVIKGGHGSYGEEIAPLDEQAIRDYVTKMKENVSAFAISSYFSIRNPNHELRAKEIVKEITGMPVVCGHELSQALGAYERGVTAYLNAQLIPITSQFIETVIGEMERRNINARLLMLKCDGSVVGIEEAKEKPIESIFSGPAASLVGASYLSDSPTCLAIDVGGTSTDVAMINDGLPEITDRGAVVGGWQTKVQALRMETSAMGGDSHVWIKAQKINIGPRRVMPLCVAASKWPSIIDKLKLSRTPSKMQMCENIQPTKFFVKTGKEIPNISKLEKEILDNIGEEPVSVTEIFIDRLPSPLLLDRLIQKRLVQAIGFTPTDALHVLGEYDAWNAEASHIGANTLGRLTFLEKSKFSKTVKSKFAHNMALYIMAYLLRKVDKEEIETIIANQKEFYSHFKVDVPVILLGGPVSAYVNEVNELLDADIILPEHAEVGNAVGAVVGKGIKRVEILIRTISKGNKAGIMMFSPHGRQKFPSYPDALEAAEKLGREIVLEYMKEAGLDREDVKVEVSKQEIKLHEGSGLPVETKLTFVGIGMPEIEK
jgi:N-methylhydantoinase A/oxoprolinase/acetone carboxylase beta subunit